MVESTTRRRRPRRSTRISQQLEQARKRNARQLAEHVAREKEVDAALEEFFAAAEEIRAADADCEQKVQRELRAIERKAAPHRRTIEQLRTEVATRVEDGNVRQARAALTLHDAGRTVEKVADLLNVSQREARQLVSAGREARATHTEHPAQETASGTTGRVGDAPSGRPQVARAVDGHDDGTDTDVVASVADGDGDGDGA